jgi:hypothetical protein
MKNIEQHFGGCSKRARSRSAGGRSTARSAIIGRWAAPDVISSVGIPDRFMLVVDTDQSKLPYRIVPDADVAQTPAEVESVLKAAKRVRVIHHAKVRLLQFNFFHAAF